MKRVLIALAAILMLVGSAVAKDRKDYQVGVLQEHTQNTERVGTDFSTIHCNVDSERCVGSASGIYNDSNWWDIRIDGADGYWELQPNWQDNSKHNPLNTAKKGDKILFRMGKKHYINGTMDVAYLPRTDDPDKEIFLLAKWVPDHPVVVLEVKPKSQLEVACAAHKLSPEQEKQLCTPAALAEQAAPVKPDPTDVPAVPVLPEMTKEESKSVQATPVELSDPRIARLKVMCEHGMITVPAVRQMSCDLYGFNYPGKQITSK